jgi:hypothetical protein
VARAGAGGSGRGSVAKRRSGGRCPPALTPQKAGRCTRDRAEMSRMLRPYSQVADSGRLLDRKYPTVRESPPGATPPSLRASSPAMDTVKHACDTGRHVPASFHNSSLIPGTAAPARLHIRRLSEPAAAPACFCESATTKSGTAALFAVTGVGSPSMRIAGIQSSHGGKCQFQLAQDPGGVARECQPWLLSSHAASTSAESKIKGGRH